MYKIREKNVNETTKNMYPKKTGDKFLLQQIHRI